MSERSGDLMCVWKPRREAVMLNGMRLCEVCGDVFVKAGMCESCRQIDMDLESRRLAAESEGRWSLVVATATERPNQPRVRMGIEPTPRRFVANVFVALLWFALGWALAIVACVWGPR